MTRRKRVNVKIDFMGIDVQTAQILPSVTVSQLTQEILVEFGLEYPFLNQHKSDDYTLCTADGYNLAGDQLVQQLGNRITLSFRERKIAIPETAVATSSPFYLRYRTHIFKIAWQPALIGRPRPGASDNNLLAVNLEPFSLAVSRRQAEIMMKDGRYVIRCLNKNPVLLNGTLLPFVAENADSLPTTLLKNGDEILLQSSGIQLICLQPNILSESAPEPAVKPEVAL